MAKQLERQLEFEFMKDVKVKDIRQDKGVKLIMHWLYGMIILPPLITASYMYRQQIHESIKNSIEYLF